MDLNGPATHSHPPSRRHPLHFPGPPTDVPWRRTGHSECPREAWWLLLVGSLRGNSQGGSGHSGTQDQELYWWKWEEDQSDWSHLCILPYPLLAPSLHAQQRQKTQNQNTTTPTHSGKQSFPFRSSRDFPFESKTWLAPRFGIWLSVAPRWSQMVRAFNAHRLIWNPCLGPSMWQCAPLWWHFSFLRIAQMK